MVNATPKWVWNRYALLWKKFKDKQFTYEEAEKVLKFDDKSAISVTFMELRKSGWLSVVLSQEDARKRIYTLSNPTKIIEEVEYVIKKSNS